MTVKQIVEQHFCQTCPSRKRRGQCPYTGPGPFKTTCCEFDDAVEMVKEAQLAILAEAQEKDIVRIGAWLKTKMTEIRGE